VLHEKERGGDKWKKKLRDSNPLFPGCRRNVAEAILTVGGFLHNWQVQGFHNIPKQGMSGLLSVRWIASSGIQVSRLGFQVRYAGQQVRLPGQVRYTGQQVMLLGQVYRPAGQAARSGIQVSRSGCQVRYTGQQVKRPGQVYRSAGQAARSGQVVGSGCQVRRSDHLKGQRSGILVSAGQVGRQHARVEVR
jgi:hypothetical protein